MSSAATQTPQPVRDAFVTAMKRDTSGTELTRMVSVLDALVGWSLAHPEQLAVRADERTGTISVERLDTKVLFWTAKVMRAAAPVLEIYPPTGRALSAADRTKVMETLNTHSREVLVEGDRLRIGFGALKNDAARAAVLALLEDLLASAGRATPPAAG